MYRTHLAIIILAPKRALLLAPAYLLLYKLYNQSLETLLTY